MSDKGRDESRQDRRGGKRDGVMTTGAARQVIKGQRRDLRGDDSHDKRHDGSRQERRDGRRDRVVTRGAARHMMKGLTKAMTRDVARVATRGVTMT